VHQVHGIAQCMIFHNVAAISSSLSSHANECHSMAAGSCNTDFADVLLEDASVRHVTLQHTTHDCTQPHTQHPTMRTAARTLRMCFWKPPPCPSSTALMMRSAMRCTSCESLWSGGSALPRY
jgi:hypothetical protein